MIFQNKKIYVHSPSHPSKSVIHLPSIYFLLKNDHDLNGKQDLEWIEPIVYENSIEESFEYLKQHGPLDYYVMSIYSWNEDNHLALAMLVKEEWPDVIIIAGGYQITSAWTEFLYIDFVINGDPEQHFHKVVDGLITDRYTENYLESWDSSAILNNSADIKDMINNTADRYPGYEISYVYESNRGCPYSCVFCAWGLANRAKVRIKELNTIDQELQVLLIDTKLHILRMADANFGIIDHDTLIADMIIKYGNDINSVDISWAKKNKHKIFDIIEKLVKKGILDRFKYGIQDINDEVGAAINRAESVPWQQAFDEYKASYAYKTIPLRLDLIYGLPAQTKQMFFNELQEFVNAKLDIPIIPLCQVLPNTEMASDKYKDKYGLKIRHQRSSSVPGYIMPMYRDEILENAPDIYTGDDYLVYNVCETNTATEDDIQEMIIYSGVCSALYQGGICANVYIKYPKLYEDFIKNPQYSYVNTAYNNFKEYLKSHPDESPTSIPLIQIDKRFSVTPGSYFYATFLYDSDVFYNELEVYLDTSLPKNLVTYQNTDFFDKQDYVFKMAWRGQLSPIYQESVHNGK